MSKNFDFKGRLAGNNFGQQMNTQAASVVSTLAGRTAKDSGWTKKFQVLDIPLKVPHKPTTTATTYLQLQSSF